MRELATLGCEFVRGVAATEGRFAPRPHVIILNGVGSVGKSSTARAFQTITATPFLHIAMDTFIDMLPEGMFGHPDGLVFETVQDQPSVIIRAGSVVEHAMRGMRHAIAAMAAQGNNLILDEVRCA
jgi:chloramphenicol 3-O phosphotransferase